MSKNRTRRLAGAAVAGALALTGLAAAPVASAQSADSDADPAATSLPSVSTGERPGPDILYAPEPDLPQLQNRHGWFRAETLRVSGAERYRRGEYQYTDHLYDDYGADTDGSGGSSLSESAGDFTYPADRARYGDNGADLFELRIARRGDGMRVRFTLNTLLADDAAIAFLAFDADDDDTTGSDTLPRDPGAPFPGTDHVLTVWGTSGEWSSWNGTAWETTPVATTVDLEANQITSKVPASLVEPTGTWQATAGVGLFDIASGGWQRPDPDASGIYNLGFRFDEAFLGANTGSDTDQAAALADNEPTRFEHPIDFDLLESQGVDDRSPTDGTMVRFYPSRLDLGEGRGTGFPGRIGQLVPYSIYVPTIYDGSPVPFTLNLHSLGQFHWQYNGSTGIQQLGEQRGSIVATPDGRGEDGWYQNEGEADTFEVWSDVARHFALDPDKTGITGYSMGGYGTYRLGGLYPDLFGKAMTIVGPPGDGIWIPGTSSVPLETLSNAWLENTRNLPYMNLAGAEDELVPVPGPTQQNVGPAGPDGLQSFDSLGYRFKFQLFPAAEHFTIALLSYDVPQAVDFFGDAAVDRDPFHVTFAYAPGTDDTDLGLIHDKAYWVSSIELADDTVGEPIAKGVVDAKSLAFGLDDPTSSPGGDAGVGPLPYTEINRTWSDPAVITPENCVVLDLANVASFSLDAPRARLDVLNDICLRVTSTDAAVVTIVGPDGKGREVEVAAGTNEYVLTALPPGTVVPEGQPILLLLAGAAAIVAFVAFRRRPTQTSNQASNQSSAVEG